MVLFAPFAKDILNARSQPIVCAEHACGPVSKDAWSCSDTRLVIPALGVGDRDLACYREKAPDTSAAAFVIGRACKDRELARLEPAANEELRRGGTTGIVIGG